MSSFWHPFANMAQVAGNEVVEVYAVHTGAGKLERVLGLGLAVEAEAGDDERTDLRVRWH